MSITVAEFKQWLCGVEEMQSDDWHPSAEQWIKIRNKIEQLQLAQNQQPNQQPAQNQQYWPPKLVTQNDTITDLVEQTGYIPQFI
jgi:hypothetical protein